ncbi:MAG TPA: hypothetical protein VFU88_08350 [Ktedonobacterales bacterium]|nr:hypothetical protein [Ktedonobacterales bacterium]
MRRQDAAGLEPALALLGRTSQQSRRTWPMPQRARNSIFGQLACMSWLGGLIGAGPLAELLAVPPRVAGVGVLASYRAAFLVMASLALAGYLFANVSKAPPFEIGGRSCAVMHLCYTRRASPPEQSLGAPLQGTSALLFYVFFRPTPPEERTPRRAALASTEQAVETAARRAIGGTEGDRVIQLSIVTPVRLCGLGGRQAIQARFPTASPAPLRRALNHPAQGDRDA